MNLSDLAYEEGFWGFAYPAGSFWDAIGMVPDHAAWHQPVTRQRAAELRERIADWKGGTLW